MGSFSDDEECPYFDAQEINAPSISEFNCDGIEAAIDTHLRFKNWVDGSLVYDVWNQSPKSVHERRRKFLKWMELGLDQTLPCNGNSLTLWSDWREGDGGRLRDNSCAESSDFEDVFWSGRSSMSCWSSDDFERSEITSTNTIMYMDDGINGESSTKNGDRNNSVRFAMAEELELEETSSSSPSFQQMMRMEAERANIPLRTEQRVNKRWLKKLRSAACIFDKSTGLVVDDDDDDDDDDWEGVESTELDELFSAATAFVAASAADRLSPKVSNEVQLQLYGYYKIATEGPCSTPQPSALKMTARAKWQAWQKLGAMPPEEAMQKYIDLVTELYPSWVAGASGKSKDGNADAKSKDSRGPMGPVFSTFVYEETGNDLELEAIHAFAREGELENLLKSVESGVSVNIKDSEGRTPLHWAVDRGHSNVVELLVSRNADINEKDIDGQTPLHYAVVCDRKSIAEYLVKNNANINEKDNDGKSPCDLCESIWPFMVSAGK
ncbi:acyl-CoA-binding domain-containing protein 1-like isoform X3 [Cucurbita moschata]|uniref:Acyl-CoA-binding domain-containing protein 1-like isoform X3 n=1 Tax=Cucurbita moschata TaxID=3662 RepID=A0A6J1E2S3_CUCMO|nr:acyl-CoA-binding domain-containing protein 1-like isoform X3 [Cucurbita moschata]